MSRCVDVSASQSSSSRFRFSFPARSCCFPPHPSLLPPPPERIRPVCCRNHVGHDGRAEECWGNGYRRQNLTCISHHISHLGHHHAFVTGFYLFVCLFVFLSFLQRQNRLFHPAIWASSSGGGVYTEIRGSAAEFVSER